MTTQLCRDGPATWRPLPPGAGRVLAAFGLDGLAVVLGPWFLDRGNTLASFDAEGVAP